MTRRLVAAAALTVVGLLTLGGSATAQTSCDGTINVCPDVAPQVGPVIDRVGDNVFDLGGLFG